MNANKNLNAFYCGAAKMVAGGCLLLSLSLMAHAEQGLNASSQSKVDNAKAKAWARSDGNKGGYERQDDKRVVNLGSKRSGNCSVNVGTVEPGKKAPKEIVVTTKEVINVCK